MLRTNRRSSPSASSSFIPHEVWMLIRSIRARMSPRSRRIYAGVLLLILGTIVLRLINLSLGAAFQVHINHEPKSIYGRSYTIRVNTFRRNDFLKGFLRHFTSCPNVHEIQVVWSDQENSPPPLSYFQLDPSSRVLVQFEEQPTDSLNNRFRPILSIDTPAVLSLDDDLEIACEDLDFAYSVWQSSPQSLVGFTPRLITWDDAHLGYRYQSSYKIVWWHGLYNMILTKCCFMHKDFLSSYFTSLSQETLEHIDKHRNCEDIAMQFVVSNQTGGIPPVWVQARFKDRGVKSGISQGKDHEEERSACVTRLVKEFGHMPLTLTSHKAINAKKAWIF